MGKVYPYRTTEAKLSAAFKRIESSGDVVEHVVYKGGFAGDYLLICREDSAVTDSRDEQSRG